MPGDAPKGNSKNRPANLRLSNDQAAFLQKVELKAARKLRAQSRGDGGVWFGLGMSGVIGWSVALPTLLGAMLGIWLDRRHPGRYSWTLTLLLAGLAIGGFNAWHWLTKEQKAMHDEPEDPHE